jgi:hypothetical protein
MLFKDILFAVRVISHLKQQFVITYTVRQTEIPALLDSWVTKPPVKMLYPQKKNYLCLHLHKNMTGLIVGLLGISQASSVSCEIVY